jgi:hypothetical protein
MMLVGTMSNMVIPVREEYAVERHVPRDRLGNFDTDPEERTERMSGRMCTDA